MRIDPNGDHGQAVSFTLRVGTAAVGNLTSRSLVHASVEPHQGRAPVGGGTLLMSQPRRGGKGFANHCRPAPSRYGLQAHNV